MIQPDQLTDIPENKAIAPTKTLVEIHGYCELVDNDDEAEAREMIAQNLKPGVPLFFETFKTIGRLGSRRIQRKAHIFLSDGTMDQLGRFGVQDGRYGTRSHVTYSGDKMEIFNSSNVTYESFRVPYSTKPQPVYNEGTFSPGGMYLWGYTEGSSQGCSKLIIGEKVTKMYPEAVGSVEFVRDSVHFHHPDFYSANRPVVFSQGAPKLLSPEADKIRHETSKKEGLAFATAMLIEAITELDAADLDRRPGSTRAPFQRHVALRQARKYRDGINGFVSDDGYLIMPDDYVIYEGCYPDRRIGYFKLDPFQDVFFLPYKGFKNAAKLASSIDYIKKFYPKA